MSQPSTHHAREAEPDEDDQGRLRSTVGRLSGFFGRGRKGTVAMIAGGALLARALRTKGRLRTVVQGLAGLGLIAVGVRQRLTREGRFETTESDASTTGEEEFDTTESIETSAITEHSQMEGTNPRDVDQEPDVDTETGDDEGRVQFTTDPDAEPRAEPEDEGPGDSRQEENDDDVEVDISETAMADEPAEAVGPDTEQAFPTQTDDVEPEETPPEDSSGKQVDPDEDETTGPGDEETDEGTADDEADDVSTEDRYEGERGEDGTVEEGTDDETDDEN